MTADYLWCLMLFQSSYFTVDIDDVFLFNLTYESSGPRSSELTF